MAGAELAVLLDRYLCSWRHRPFAWGEADCVRFAAGWVVSNSVQKFPGRRVETALKSFHL